MNDDMKKVFSDFKLYEKVSEDIINKYRDKVGDDVVEIWKKYGFGTTFNGYLKIINPDDVQELLEETYIMPFGDIPIFVTGMGDIITCNNRGSFVIADYRHQRIKGLRVDREIAYNECFGYEPLLSLGGKENVDNLRKVNYEVHITIMAEIQGVLSC